MTLIGCVHLITLFQSNVNYLNILLSKIRTQIHSATVLMNRIFFWKVIFFDSDAASAKATSDFYFGLIVTICSWASWIDIGSVNPSWSFFILARVTSFKVTYPR